MSKQIKISVCITTRNRAGFIGETIESIISQAGENVEIVILDGASTDNTSEIVNRYKQKFSNLMYHRAEKNSGVDRRQTGSDQAECPTDKDLGLKKRRYLLLNLHFARHKISLSLKWHGPNIAYNMLI